MEGFAPRKYDYHKAYENQEDYEDYEENLKDEEENAKKTCADFQTRFISFKHSGNLFDFRVDIIE